MTSFRGRLVWADSDQERTDQRPEALFRRRLARRNPAASAFLMGRALSPIPARLVSELTPRAANRLASGADGGGADAVTQIRRFRLVVTRPWFRVLLAPPPRGSNGSTPCSMTPACPLSLRRPTVAASAAAPAGAAPRSWLSRSIPLLSSSRIAAGFCAAYRRHVPPLPAIAITTVYVE